MRKVPAIIVSLLVVSGLIWGIPRWQRYGSARPLYGIFDIQLKCCDGHESFLELSENDVYETCPGHRERRRVTKVVRDGESATVIDPRDGKPWFQIRWDGSKHSLEFFKRPDSQSWFGMIPVRGDIEQVIDPWRLWVPRILPE